MEGADQGRLRELLGGGGGVYIRQSRAQMRQPLPSLSSFQSFSFAFVSRQHLLDIQV